MQRPGAGLEGHKNPGCCETCDTVTSYVKWLDVPVTQAGAVDNALLGPLNHVRENDEEYKKEWLQQQYPCEQKHKVCVPGFVAGTPSLEEMGQGGENREHHERQPLWNGWLRPCQGHSGQDRPSK